MRAARYGRQMAVAAALAVAALVAPAPAMAAVSGGGCGSGTHAGSVLRPCISYSGGVVRPDYYLSGKVAYCNQVLWYDLIEDVRGEVDWGPASNFLGHHVLPTYKPARGRAYRLRLSCNFPDGTFTQVSSPWQFV